jgi:hypothetical protein
VVAEFKLHSAKENAPDMCKLHELRKSRDTHLAYMLGWVMTYSSLSRSSKVRMALPSIIVPALKR